jgi:hypothetical protein
MAKRQANGSDRARRILAQEAARIIVEQGIEDYRAAKIKAAERLGMSTRGALPAVLHGTANANSAVNLHVFADDAETVAARLQDCSVHYRPFERRLKSRRDHAETFAAFRFNRDEAAIEATVFPVDGVRQAPISPVDGKPMRRADVNAILKLLAQ